jgi:hypothetical protein
MAMRIVNRSFSGSLTGCKNVIMPLNPFNDSYRNEKEELGL